MAQAVTKDKLKPTDWRKLVQKVRGAIKPKKDKIASINGEIAGMMSDMENQGGNKLGIRIFGMLDKLEPEDRTDVLRTLNGMSDAAGWPEFEEQDLADKAEGTVVRARFGKDAAPGATDAEEEMDEIEAEEVNPEQIDDARDGEGFHDPKLAEGADKPKKDGIDSK